VIREHQLCPPQRRARRWFAGIAIGLAAFLCVWLLGGYFIVVHPAHDRPTKADAIVVLGPPKAQNRFAQALQLAEQGYASNLVVSVNLSVPDIKRMCANPPDGLHMFCFNPSPATTRGEAREIKALAEANGWHRVIVMTSAYHISRARMIVQRCYSGDLEMVEARGHISPRQWAYQYLYQTAGYTKAFLLPRC
jgi:uncharacterized SAM-binding protein YcdF (DUF218 family)